MLLACFWPGQHEATDMHSLSASTTVSGVHYAANTPRHLPRRHRCLAKLQAVLNSDVTSVTMPLLPQPQDGLLTEIGRRSVLPNGARQQADLAADRPLAPFACAMTGTPAEVPDARSCEVHGTLPDWLQGNLYRNGPGTFDIRTDGGQVYSIPHWFSGLTVMHKFQISLEGVTYRNKHLNRETEHFIQAENRYPGLQVWTDPCGSLMGRAFSTMKQMAKDHGPGMEYTDPKTGKPGKGNIGVTVGSFRGNKLVSRTDANVLLELDPEDMHVKKQSNYTAVLPEAKGTFSASHVERDEAKGLTYNYAMDFTLRGKGLYKVFCIPDDESQEPYVLAEVQDDACYVHSFATTENYIVLMLWPCQYSPLKMVINRSVYSDLQWRPENGVKFYVIDKTKGGKGHVATFRHDAFFCFHNINAFESGDNLVVDLAAYKDNQVLAQLHRSNVLFGKSIDSAIATRFTLPNLSAAAAAGKDCLADASSRSLMTDPMCFELFTIHPGFKCQPYQYSYGASLQASDTFYSQLIKLDVKSGTTTLWREEGTFPGEPIFVPRPGGVKEDDGVLLSVVLAGVQERSFLLVLEASNMQEVARAWTEHPVSLGFHGHFSELGAFKQSTPPHSNKVTA